MTFPFYDEKRQREWQEWLEERDPVAPPVRKDDRRDIILLVSMVWGLLGAAGFVGAGLWWLLR